MEAMHEKFEKDYSHYSDSTLLLVLGLVLLLIVAFYANSPCCLASQK